MTSTRDKILQALLRKPRSTINDLAEVAGINPISVRHHLSKTVNALSVLETQLIVPSMGQGKLDDLLLCPDRLNRVYDFFLSLES